MPRIVPLPARPNRETTAVSVDLDLNAAWGLYDKQARFVFGSSLFAIMLGGVGSGKSVALVCKAIVLALRNPGSTGALLGRTGVDLSTVLLPSLFDMLAKAQEQCGISLISDYDKGNACLTLINGSKIWFRPYNRIQKIRGLTLTWACADEVEFSEANPEEIWSVLTGRLRGKGPCPQLAFATSPNGLRGITAKFVTAQRHYQVAIQNNDLQAQRTYRQYNVVTATSFDNPYLPEYFFDSLRSMSKRRYEQEALGKVLQPLNTVLSLEPRHMVDHDWRTKENRNLAWILCVDWGGQDHHVALMIQIDRKNKRYVVADELIGDGMPRGKFQRLLSDWVTSKGIDPCVAGVDRAAPGENQILQSRLRNTPIRFMDSKIQQKVSTGVEYIRDLMDPQSVEPQLVFAKSLAQVTTGVTAPICPALRNYCFHMDSDGIPRDIPNKDNINDHMPDAMRYGLMAAKDYASSRL